MPDTRPRLFLERGSYRQRRLIDAVRLVAVLGAFLWMVPLIWPLGDGLDGPSISMSRALFYVFGVWFLLICIAALLSRKLGKIPATSTQNDNGAQ